MLLEIYIVSLVSGLIKLLFPAFMHAHFLHHLPRSMPETHVGLVQSSQCVTRAGWHILSKLIRLLSRWESLGCHVCTADHPTQYYPIFVAPMSTMWALRRPVTVVYMFMLLFETMGTLRGETLNCACYNDSMCATPAKKPKHKPPAQLSEFNY